MYLPHAWQSFLEEGLDVVAFHRTLRNHLNAYDEVIPRKEDLFNALKYVEPQEVTCVLFGEDPYPRITSANGVAFWDAEIKSWQDKTNGNGLKNILKALLVADDQADYFTPITECRQIAVNAEFPQPNQLFERWLNQGILLINTSMTYSSPQDKRKHFSFWQPFHRALIQALNRRTPSPFYVLWGRKAWRWEADIRTTIDDVSKIIKQGHPTFIHQFLDKKRPRWSPFVELRQRTGLEW